MLQTTAQTDLTAVAGGAWDSRFNLAGATGVVNALVLFNGKLAAGGAFGDVGRETAKNLALWDGLSWKEIGGGVDGPVFALAASGNKLFVGGRFSRVGGLGVSNVAMWDGSAWQPLAGGISGAGDLTTVYALAVAGDGSLYAGGYFTTAGGQSAFCIARWDGSAWHAVGGGVGSAVYALAINGTDLFAGGRFQKAGNVTANRIARYDGTWHALGAGVNDDVYALAVWNNTLFAGGRFTSAGAASAAGVASWNGTAWTALGTGTPGTVYSLHDTGSALAVGGVFETAGGIPSRGMAFWNGSWQGAGTGISGPGSGRGVFSIASAPSGAWGGARTFVGGNFLFAGTVTTSALATWTSLSASGGAWQALDGGPSLGATGPVRAMASKDGILYAGGYFESVGPFGAARIAAWNGLSWSTLGAGVTDGAVLAVAGSTAGVFAGGTFLKAGGQKASRVAWWNGSSWNTMNGGVSGGTTPTIFALAASGNTVYAGGEFTKAGSTPANRVAAWDGSKWNALGSGVEQGAVLALAVGDGGVVYVGGSFRTAGGLTLPFLARWNGSAWSSVGGGTNGEVHALVFRDGKLYVGGSFTRAGNVNARGVAMWDGAKWTAYGSGLEGDAVSVLRVDGNKIYAGGSFLSSGGSTMNHLALWDGAQWLHLEGGTNRPVRALEVIGSNLYAGGYFTRAGSQASGHIALWASDTASLTCPLAAGWNLTSLNIEPATPSMSGVVGPLSTALELVRDNAGLVYWPSQQIAQFSSWSKIQGYDIYMNAAATLSVAGVPINAASTAIPLSKGWNIIPFLPNQSMSTSSALSGIQGKFVLVKDAAGNPYWPEQQIDEISTLRPCQGYRIYVPEDGVSLLYPVSGVQAQTSPEQVVVGTGSDATLMVELPQAAAGTTVEVWTRSGSMVGRAVAREGRALVILRGDNPHTPQVEGAAEDEELTLSLTGPDGARDRDQPKPVRIVDVLSNEETDVLRYRQDAVTRVDMQGLPSPTGFRLQAPYPNPARTASRVAFTLPTQEAVHLAVYDATGRHLMTLIDEVRPAGVFEAGIPAEGLSAGTYFVRYKAMGRTQVQPLVIVR